MATPFDPFLPPEEQAVPPPPAPGEPPRRRWKAGEGADGKMSKEQRTALSAALAPYRGQYVDNQRQQRGADTLGQFFAQPEDNSYSRTAREDILYEGAWELMNQGLDPNSDEFQAGLEAYANQPEVQQRLQDIQANEFFTARGGNTNADFSEANYDAYLNELNNPEEMARRRQAYQDFQATMGGLGDVSGLNPFGTENEYSARTRFLNEGGDAFKAWAEGNLNSERAARDQALATAKALGLESDYLPGNRPGQGWQSLADQLGARQSYQTAFDAFQSNPRARQRDARNVQDLHQAWQGMANPFQGFNITPLAPVAPTPQPQAPVSWQMGSANYDASGNLTDAKWRDDPFSAFQSWQAPSNRQSATQGQQAPFWSPTAQAPQTPAQTNTTPNRPRFPNNWGGASNPNRNPF